MRVNEIRGLAPVSEWYELDPKAKYLIVIHERMAMESRVFIRMHLRKLGIECQIVDGCDLKLLKIHPEPENV